MGGSTRLNTTKTVPCTRSMRTFASMWVGGTLAPVQTPTREEKDKRHKGTTMRHGAV